MSPNSFESGTVGHTPTAFRRNSTIGGIATVDVPVLIIGGGPTGLLQGHLLSKLGGSFTKPRNLSSPPLIQACQ